MHKNEALKEKHLEYPTMPPKDNSGLDELAITDVTKEVGLKVNTDNRLLRVSISQEKDNFSKKEPPLRQSLQYF